MTPRSHSVIAFAVVPLVAATLACSRPIETIGASLVDGGVDATAPIDASGDGEGGGTVGGGAVDAGEGDAASVDSGADGAGCTEQECVDDCAGDPTCITECGC